MKNSQDTKNTNLASMRVFLNKNFSHYKVGPGERFTFFTKKGKKFEAHGVRVREGGDHVFFYDTFGNRLLFPLSAQRLKSKTIRNIAISVIGLFVSLTAGLSANLISHFFRTEPPQIESRLEELSNIRTSLEQLDGYVKGQQDELARMSNSLKTMKEEKNTLETILSANRTEIEAITGHILSRTNTERWIERIISFFIGVFSSLTAAFVFNYFRNIRVIAQQSGEPDRENGSGLSG